MKKLYALVKATTECTGISPEITIIPDIGVGLNVGILWEEALHSALMPITPQASMASLADGKGSTELCYCGSWNPYHYLCVCGVVSGMLHKRHGWK